MFRFKTIIAPKCRPRAITCLLLFTAPLPLLAGCTHVLPPQAPPPVAAGGPAVILAIRPLPATQANSAILAALDQAHPTARPTGTATPAAEVTIRTDDGRTLTLVQRPPPGWPRGTTNVTRRVRLVQAGTTATLAPP